MKISHRLREQAALILQVAASNEDLVTWSADHYLYGAPYGVGGPAGQLARSVLARSVLKQVKPWSPVDAYAEAEAMLRCGWSPT